MSMPTIPDIKPKIEISIEETIKLLLASIALEELSLAHIMNAEAEKIQEIIKCTGDKKYSDTTEDKLHDLLLIDKSVDKMLKDIIKKEMLLEFKFENILELCKTYKEKDRCKDKDD
ncbi:hypothetical protein JOD02_002069 [Caldicoprobacter guelmensis]|uniref:hypothetical protein n=1 Tax=Caldicoprobacter guelmensis TaxID=1170224 RepID=UPI00195A2AF3|nr:hypothetical protein [Caldicoprobacter guelmensis]MBM7583191.1 hypothetical protein [Caldicoprobacter guelmensis]